MCDRCSSPHKRHQSWHCLFSGPSAPFLSAADPGSKKWRVRSNRSAWGGYCAGSFVAESSSSNLSLPSSSVPVDPCWPTIRIWSSADWTICSCKGGGEPNYFDEQLAYYLFTLLHRLVILRVSVECFADQAQDRWDDAAASRSVALFFAHLLGRFGRHHENWNLLWNLLYLLVCFLPCWRSENVTRRRRVLEVVQQLSASLFSKSGSSFCPSSSSCCVRSLSIDDGELRDPSCVSGSSGVSTFGSVPAKKANVIPSAKQRHKPDDESAFSGPGKVSPSDGFSSLASDIESPSEVLSSDCDE